MFKRILLALDGSEKAEAGLTWVRHVASRDKPLVVLLRVATWPVPIDPELLQHAVVEARDYLQGMERELNFVGVPAKVVVKTGPPADHIVAAAGENRSEVIVLTARGGSKVKRWLVGGTAEQVMRMSEIPVLLVRGPSPKRIARILVPVDGSKLAEKPIEEFVKIARHAKASLLFLHVCPPGRKSAAYENEFSRIMRRFVSICAKLKTRGVRASFRAEMGDAADHIVKAAARCQMIAMTTHGRGGVKRWIFGSIAEKVVHAAPVPVLIWKSR